MTMIGAKQQLAKVNIIDHILIGDCIIRPKR